MIPSMTPLRLKLLNARKSYSKCANLVEGRISASDLSQSLSEQIIGIGVAADWLRKAAEMDDISFIGKQLNESEHKRSFVELLRFNFTWFGLNAIFSRPRLRDLIGQPNSISEFDDFLVLFNSATIPNANVHADELHAILAKSTSPRIPGQPPGTTVSTLYAIESKYLQHAANKGRTASYVSTAARSGNVTALNLPTLIYAFRNWSVHGAAIDGSFGTRPGFVRYVEILQDVMADVHFCTAQTLANRL